MSGKKSDANKAPLSMLPYEALVEAARVFDFGQKKYSRDNWRQGLDYTRLIDATLRHINEFNNGEDLDPESGHSHIGHALCGLLMLMSHIKRGYGTDDRFTDKVSEVESPTCPCEEQPIAICQECGATMSEDHKCGDWRLSVDPPFPLHRPEPRNNCDEESLSYDECDCNDPDCAYKKAFGKIAECQKRIEEHLKAVEEAKIDLPKLYETTNFFPEIEPVGEVLNPNCENKQSEVFTIGGCINAPNPVCPSNEASSKTCYCNGIEPCSNCGTHLEDAKEKAVHIISGAYEGEMVLFPCICGRSLRLSNSINGDTATCGCGEKFVREF